MVIVTCRNVEAAVYRVEELVVVGIEGQQPVDVFLRPVRIIISARCVILCGFRTDVFRAFSFGIVVAQCGVKLQFGKKMHPVVNIEVPDKAHYLAVCVALFQQSDRVHQRTVYRISVASYRFVEPSEGIIARIDGDGGVHGGSSPNG